MHIIGLKHCLVLLISLLFLHYREEVHLPVSVISPSSSIHTALIFIKEKKIEIWSEIPIPTRLYSFQPEYKLNQLQVGQFPIAKNNPSSLNEVVSKLESFNVTELVVLPNDYRISGQFEPCFACPHSTAAVYAKLELLIHRYSLKN